jgi:hypothetical protein
VCGRFRLKKLLLQMQNNSVHAPHISR